LRSLDVGCTNYALSRSARKAPTASSACAAAFNLPMLPGNPCGIPIHTSARASTPAATARFECHVVAWQYALHESVELRACFDTGSRALGRSEHGAHGGGNRCIFGIERMYRCITGRCAVFGQSLHGQLLFELARQLARISRAACWRSPLSCGPGSSLRPARSRSAYASHRHR
jgi:hypothetical protein